MKFKPVDVREVLKRITGKVIVSLLKEHVIKTPRSVKICVGWKTGIEAAIHSVKEMHNEEKADGILLVDVISTINFLNRQSFLHNISYLCPSISTLVKMHHQGCLF